MANESPTLLIDTGEYKGLDAWTSGYYIDAKRATDLLNVLPETHLGSFYTVLGRTPLITGVLPSACLGLTRFDRQGLASEYVAASNVNGTTGGLYYALAGATSWTQATLPTGTTLTPNQPTDFCQYQQWLFVTNGTNTPLKIDMNMNVTVWQPAAPSAAPTATDSGSSGTLSGTYYYRITYGNSVLETSPGPISSAVTVTGHSVTVSGLPSTAPDPQLTQINIYRLGGTYAVWKYVSSVNFGTTSFTDNVADAALGPLLILYRDPPNPYWYIVPHKERIFGFGTNTAPSDIAYTNYKEPWGWNQTTQVFPVGRNLAGDIAMGLASTGSILIMFKAHTTWALYGDTSQDFLPRQLFFIGCIAPLSVIAALGVVFWLARDGWWMFDGIKPSRISSNIQSVIYGLAVSDLQQAVSFYRNGFVYLSFPTKGVTYAYNLATQENYKLGWACDRCYFDPNLAEVTASRPGLGNVDSWFATTTDLGSTIIGSFVGKLEDSGKPEAIKRYRYGVLLAPLQSGQSVTLTLVVDPGPSQKSDVRTLSLNNATVRQRVSYPPPLRGYTAQLTIVVSANGAQVEIQKAQVYGWVERSFAP